MYRPRLKGQSLNESALGSMLWYAHRPTVVKAAGIVKERREHVRSASPGCTMSRYHARQHQSVIALSEAWISVIVPRFNVKCLNDAFELHVRLHPYSIPPPPSLSFHPIEVVSWLYFVN
jgi:hypothetical protein